MDKERDDSSEQNAFSFKIAKTKKRSVINSKTYDEVEPSNEKDYLVETAGNLLVSKKPSKEKQKLVIPMSKAKDWRLVNRGNGDNVEIEAAEELIKDIEVDHLNDKSDLETIGLANTETKNADLSKRKMIKNADAKESTITDYEDIPVASFGAALLRGMGWSEGKPLGLTNKGLAAPIEYIPRHKGLGLGAEKQRTKNNENRKRKLGDENLKQTNFSTVIDSEGRVRHIKQVGEEVKEKIVGFFPGSHILIVKGVHKDLYGKIVAVDEDTARITVTLALSGETIQISQYNTDLVDREIFKKYSTFPVNKQKRSEEPKMQGKLEDFEDNFEKPWLMPNIRVRIISKTFKNGSYYNQKVKLIDVVEKDTCTCLTQSNKLLEGIPQMYLETVIPKNNGDYILVVNGKYKGKIGKLLEKHKADCRATIQLTSNKHITTLGYHKISEFIGELPDDEFL